MNKKPLLIASLALLVAGIGVSFQLLIQHEAPRIPNFIDSGDSDREGEELLQEYKERLKEHLEEGGEPIDAFFSEIRLLDYSSLGIGPDDVLADLGCGVGTLGLALLDQKVPFRKLYALDVNRHSLAFLRFALEETGLDPGRRIKPVRSKRDDLTLPEDEVDILFIVEVPAIYFALTRTGHYENDDAAYAAMERLFASIRSVLKPTGELHFIYPTDSRTSGTLDPELLVAAMAQNGFVLVQQSKLVLALENHYFIFRQADGPAGAVRPPRTPRALPEATEL
jgi:SAM-dependent methyltransferase